MSLYFVRFNPTDCAAMGLSRMAMMGAARAGAREIEHDDERHHHKDEARGETRDGLGAGRALRALDDGVARGVEAEIVDRLGAGNIEEDVQARSVIADEQAVDEIRDDLAEGRASPMAR